MCCIRWRRILLELWAYMTDWHLFNLSNWCSPGIVLQTGSTAKKASEQQRLSLPFFSLFALFPFACDLSRHSQSPWRKEGVKRKWPLFPPLSPLPLLIRPFPLVTIRRVLKRNGGGKEGTTHCFDDFQHSFWLCFISHCNLWILQPKVSIMLWLYWLKLVCYEYSCWL